MWSSTVLQKFCNVLRALFLVPFLGLAIGAASMRANNFHALKSRFANFIILAMAISFLEAFATTPALQAGKQASSLTPMLISALSISTVSLALIVFNRWSGEQAS